MAWLKTMLLSQSQTSEYIDVDTLPKIGYVAWCKKKAVAAGFLRRVEGKVAMIDTLMTNAEFPSEDRHVALSKVVDMLMKAGNHMKLVGLYAHTTDKSILERASKLGFRVLPKTIIVLPLV